MKVISILNIKGGTGKTMTTINLGGDTVMNNKLVESLDKIAKRKGGYSRNELINFMCQWCVDNLKE